MNEGKPSDIDAATDAKIDRWLHGSDAATSAEVRAQHIERLQVERANEARALAMKRDEVEKLEAEKICAAVAPLRAYFGARGGGKVSAMGVLRMQSPSDDAMLAVLVKRCAELRQAFESSRADPPFSPYLAGVSVGLEHAVGIIEGRPMELGKLAGPRVTINSNPNAAMLQRDAAANVQHQAAPDFAAELNALIWRHFGPTRAATECNIGPSVVSDRPASAARAAALAGMNEPGILNRAIAPGRLHDSPPAGLAEPATRSRAECVRPTGFSED